MQIDEHIELVDVNAKEKTNGKCFRKHQEKGRDLQQISEYSELVDVIVQEKTRVKTIK